MNPEETASQAAHNPTNHRAKRRFNCSGELIRAVMAVIAVVLLATAIWTEIDARMH